MFIKNIQIVCSLIILGLLGCGGNNAPSDLAKITFSVEDLSVNGKKSKEAGQVEDVIVTSLAGEDMGKAIEIGEKKFEIEIPKGLAISILVRLVNSQQGAVDLERIIEKTKNEEFVVGKESTNIAHILREEAKNNGTNVKDFIESNGGRTDAIKEFIREIDRKEFISNILKNISDAKNAEELAEVLADAIKKLENMQVILARIENNLSRFIDGENESTVNEDDDLASDEDELIRQFAGEFEGERNAVSVEVNEAGEIIVVKGDDIARVNTGDEVRIKTVISGYIKSISTEKLTLLVKKDDGVSEVTFIHDGEYKFYEENVSNLLIDELISVKFVEEEGVKYIRGMLGRGKYLGEVVEKGENSIVVKSEKGFEVKFVPRWVSDSRDSSSANSSSSDESNASNHEENDELRDANVSKEGKKPKDGLDQEMLEVFQKLKVGDKIVVYWELEERKRAIRVELQKAESEGEHETEGGDNDSQTDSNHDAVQSVKEFKGKVVVKGEGSFSLRLVEGEKTIVIMIKRDVAFHKEILKSLVLGDVLLVKAQADGDKFILQAAKGEGVFEGELIEKTDTKISVKNAEGVVVAFTPRWVHNADNSTQANVAGGLDQEMLEKFATLTLGQKLKVTWLLEERKRAVKVSIVE